MLKVLAGCAGAGVAGAAVVPAAALVLEPARGESGPAAEWVRVTRLGALEVGRPLKVPVVGAEVDAWTRAPDRRLGAVWLVRDGEAAVRAYTTVCPHLGCGIDLERDHFVCPCHDSAFDLQGQRATGPSPRGMDPVPVRVADGWVSVQYLSFRLGGAARVPT